MNSRMSLAFSLCLILLISSSGCLETLFPYGLPGAGSDPKSAASNPESAKIPAASGQNQSPPPPPSGQAPPESQAPSAKPVGDSTAQVIAPPNASAGNQSNFTFNCTLWQLCMANQTNGSSISNGAGNAAINCFAQLSFAPNESAAADLNCSPLQDATVTYTQLAPPKTDSDYPLEILFFDAGFGDSAMIRRGNFTMLVDAGPKEREANLSASLASAAAGKIDIFVLTGWEGPESGGAQKILTKYPATIVWDNGNPVGDGANETALFFAKRNIPRIAPHEGDAYQFGDISVLFFLPPKTLASGNQNLNTLAFAVVRGAFCAFFSGQMEQESEPSLMRFASNLSCQVYEVPSHGAGRPTPSILVDKLNPQHAIVSTGPNGLGLPSPTTLERFRLRGTRVWRTDVDGSIYVNVSANGSYSISRANWSAIYSYYTSEFPPQQ